MKTYLTLLLSGSALLLLSGCCLKLSDLNSGASYQVGDVITTSGTDVLVERFQWGNGIWTDGGSATVDTRNMAGGSGLDINANNVNLNFRLDYPVNKITLRFGDYGGNSNIRINTEFRNVGDLLSLNNSTIAGVDLTFTAGQSGANWIGQLTLVGDMTDFAIGGQELWVDDICWEN